MELSAVLQAQQAEAAQVADQDLVNGDITITGEPWPEGHTINGDGSHISPYTESALPIPPMSQETSQLSSLPVSDQTVTAVNDDTPAIPTAEAPAEPAAPTPTAKPVWEAHNLDIDIVSLKLSKHKYLTPSDFLADISKIESNADKLGDPDRITRIGEMGAHARMHVMNFDPAWEPRFEAYAQRVRGRKAKRQEEKEERKRLEQAGPTVVVDGTTVSGEEPSAGEGGSLKRPREDGADDEQGDREDKRMRGDVEMDGSSLPLADTNNQSSSDITAVPPISLVSESQRQQKEEPTVPPPRLVHPPFVLPDHNLEKLQTALHHATRGFTIENLEQLRAACFDKIWRHRADWDRTDCVKGLQGLVDEFVVEVDESRESELETPGQ